MCSSKEINKKGSHHFDWVSRRATESNHSRHQREGGLSCLAWWAQSLAAARSAAEASGPRERPGNKQPLNYLTHTDSSNQPHAQDRCQPAMTFMTQSTSWWKKKKTQYWWKQWSYFSMIRVCSRTCYLDELDVINPFITTFIWWVRHRKLEQKL